MLSKLVKPGDRIELLRVDSLKNIKDETVNKRVYHSKVCEIVSEDRIEIAMPMEKEKLLLLQVDNEYDMYFYTSGGLYQCFARVVDRYKTNNIYMILMELTSNLRRQQRREYYRLSCALEMNTRVLCEDEVKEIEQKGQLTNIIKEKLNKSVIVDISGGGLRFVADQHYEEGSLVICFCHFLLDGKIKEYSLVGEVLTVKELSNRPGTYEHRVQYVNINVEEREEIIRYIFQEERKNRKKELGV